MRILNLSRVHSSWLPFFSEDRVKQIREIESCIGNNINPAANNVLRFTSLDLSKIKCCILGQDPYPSPPKEGIYVATGRSFEVGTLRFWTDSFAQHSLKNIIRLIYKAYYSELIGYEEIKKKIKIGEFRIMYPREWFDNLEQQGVLFLNTYLTCEMGKANSHRDIWKDFSKDLIEYISTTNPNIAWFLWGGEAQKNEKYIKNGKIYKSNHPRLYDTKSPHAFLNSTCFEDTKDFIEWRGADPITLLRMNLPKDLDEAIVELKKKIKKLPPKECYFRNEYDFVAPFTITSPEEMLMQLLLMEKELLNNPNKEGYTLEEVKELLFRKETDEERKEREQEYLRQAKEGYIRRFVYE